MVKKIIYGVSALLVTVIVLCFIFCRESEEEKIIRTLNEFCADAAKKQDSSPAALLLKTNILKAYFTDPCELAVHHGFLHGKYSDVRAANEIMRINLFFLETSPEISDVFISIDGETASVILTGRFYGILKDQEVVDEVREVELFMRKIDKKWRISSVEVHKILEKQ